MIRLTSVSYRVSDQATEVAFNINQLNEETLHNWKLDLEKALDTGSEYVPKPYTEDYQYLDSDFESVEKPMLLCKIDNLETVVTNEDNMTELHFENGRIITVKETIEEVEKLFAGIKK